MSRRVVESSRALLVVWLACAATCTCAPYVEASRMVEAVSSSAPSLDVTIERAQRAAGPMFAFDLRGVEAVNEDHGLRIMLRTDGAHVVAEDAEVRIALAAIGRGSRISGLERVDVSTRANVGTYSFAGGWVEEWFVNGPLGLEHGFEVTHRAGGRGPLELFVDVRGTLTPRGYENGVVLEDGTGVPVLRYGLPFARDAAGRALDVRIGVRGTDVIIMLDDRGAQYPIHVDPLVWREQVILTDSVPSGEWFGRVMAMDEDVLVAAGWGVEAVSIYRRLGTLWVLEQRIPAPVIGEDFGEAIAVQGDTLLVGARRADGVGGSDSGMVYVYLRTGGSWTLIERLEPSGMLAGARFGGAVAVGGGALAATACEDGSLGSVYVFDAGAAGFMETQRLVASDSERRMGCFDLYELLSLQADRLVLGAPSQRGMGTVSVGAAFVFERASDGAWWETARLDPPVPDDRVPFGHVVSVSADHIAVGAVDLLRRVPGAVHVFRRDTGSWELEVSLAAADAADSMFGVGVAFGAGLLAVSSVASEDDMRGSTGSVEVFRTGSWERDAILSATPGWDGLTFGWRVATDGPYIAVSGQRSGDPGRVFVFALRHEDGDACAVDDDCHSGFCVDGVCCDSECGGGATDACAACSVSAGAAIDGVCTTFPASHVCRPAAGACDVEEACDGAATACPADSYVAAGTRCREASGACDVEERCDGVSAECPSDALAGPATVCRPSAFPCDAEERCDRSSPACPADQLAPDGASCGDGLACNGAETCLGAVCIAGAPLDCDDDDACTIDSCAEPAGCVHERVCCMRDAQCDDGDTCTIDACERERCVHAVAPGCDGGTTLDGGAGDGGPVFATWGCGCGTAGSRAGGLAWCVAVLFALVLVRRRRSQRVFARRARRRRRGVSRRSRARDPEERCDGGQEPRGVARRHALRRRARVQRRGDLPRCDVHLGCGARLRRR